MVLRNHYRQLIVLESLLSAMIVAVVPPVSTMLDIGAGTGSRGPANQRTFTAANQRSAHYAGCAANQRALSLAMVMSVRTAMRRAFRRRAQHQENDRQDYRQNVLDVYRSYHFHTSYGFAQKVIFLPTVCAEIQPAQEVLVSSVRNKTLSANRGIVCSILHMSSPLAKLWSKTFVQTTLCSKPPLVSRISCSVDDMKSLCHKEACERLEKPTLSPVA
jgi:hypothetical protein